MYASAAQPIPGATPPSPNDRLLEVLEFLKGQSLEWSQLAYHMRNGVPLSTGGSTLMPNEYTVIVFNIPVGNERDHVTKLFSHSLIGVDAACIRLVEVVHPKVKVALTISKARYNSILRLMSDKHDYFASYIHDAPVMRPPEIAVGRADVEQLRRFVEARSQSAPAGVVVRGLVVVVPELIRRTWRISSLPVQLMSEGRPLTREESTDEVIERVVRAVLRSDGLDIMDEQVLKIVIERHKEPGMLAAAAAKIFDGQAFVTLGSTEEHLDQFNLLLQRRSNLFAIWISRELTQAPFVGHGLQQVRQLRIRAAAEETRKHDAKHDNDGIVWAEEARAASHGHIAEARPCVFRGAFEQSEKIPATLTFRPVVE